MRCLRVPAALVLLLVVVLVLGAGCTPGARAAEPAPDILVTRQLFTSQDWSVGQIVLLSREPGGAGAAPFRIAGVYEPTPDPMRLTAKRWEARLHLPDLLEIPGAPDAETGVPAAAVTGLRLALRDPDDAEAIAGEIAGRIPGVYAAPTAATEGDAGPFVVLERFHVAIALVTVLGSTAFLLALMVMRVEERSETLGILRILGFSKKRILLEVLIEGLLIGVAGAAFGVLFAAATQGAVNRFFQWRYDTALVFVRVTPEIAWRCIGLAVPLGMLAGLVASWTLLRREIVALVRR